MRRMFALFTICVALAGSAPGQWDFDALREEPHPDPALAPIAGASEAEVLGLLRDQKSTASAEERERRLLAAAVRLAEVGTEKSVPALEQLTKEKPTLLEAFEGCRTPILRPKFDYPSAAAFALRQQERRRVAASWKALDAGGRSQALRALLAEVPPQEQVMDGVLDAVAELEPQEAGSLASEAVAGLDRGRTHSGVLLLALKARAGELPSQTDWQRMPAGAVVWLQRPGTNAPAALLREAARHGGWAGVVVASEDHEATGTLAQQIEREGSAAVLRWGSRATVDDWRSVAQDATASEAARRTAVLALVQRGDADAREALRGLLATGSLPEALAAKVRDVVEDSQ